jgi:hypothetical protein
MCHHHLFASLDVVPRRVVYGALQGNGRVCNAVQCGAEGAVDGEVLHDRSSCGGNGGGKGGAAVADGVDLPSSLLT